jgi:MYXO-CTERM domain-containing protein
VLDALPLDARAVAAAAALAALPGVLVVRSPWRAMPLLSLAFWVTSWTWLDGGSRTQVLHGFLMVFGALVLLRIVRPGPLPRLGRPQMLVVLGAILVAVPQAQRVVPAGTRAPVDALAAELLAWHDGWPASFEPLSPRQPFQASGLAAMAADVVLLSGAPAHRAVFAMTVAADALLLLALWSLAGTRAPSGRAAVAAAAALLPAAAVATASGVLASAFAVEAVALWHDRRGHPSAFTAGACVAAAIATDVTTAPCALLLASLLSRIAADPAADHAPASPVPGRGRTAAWTAAVLALPLLWRLPTVEAPDAGSLAAVALAGLLGLVARRRSVVEWRVVASGIVVVAAGGAFLGRAADVVTRDEEAAMTWIRDHARPLDLVCAPDVPAARWIPAIAGRPATLPMGPGWPVPAGECAVRISLSGLPPPGALPSDAPAFRAGQAVVWTASQGR